MSGQWLDGKWEGCGRANHPMIKNDDREGLFRRFRFFEEKDCTAQIALADQYASKVCIYDIRCGYIPNIC